MELDVWHGATKVCDRHLLRSVCGRGPIRRQVIELEMKGIQTAIEVIDNVVMPKFHKHSGRRRITFDVKMILTGTASLVS